MLPRLVILELARGVPVRLKRDRVVAEQEGAVRQLARLRFDRAAKVLDGIASAGGARGTGSLAAGHTASKEGAQLVGDARACGLDRGRERHHAGRKRRDDLGEAGGASER